MPFTRNYNNIYILVVLHNYNKKFKFHDTFSSYRAYFPQLII